MSNRPWPQLLLLGLALLSVLAAFAGAQQSVRIKIPPPEFKREWEVDAAGLRQWKAFDAPCAHCKGVKSHVCEHCKETKFPVCLECDGKKRAPCRPCAGTGKELDPLVELVCTYCSGSSWYPCGLCNGFGSLTVEGNETKCGACKQKGLLKCQACSGQRKIETVRIGKKHPGEAGAKELREVRDRLTAGIAALDKWEPDENPSRSAKALAKALEPLERDLKVVKDMQKMLEDVLKGVKSYGAGYTGFAENLMQEFFVFEDRTVYVLQHQVRAVEQALERAEFNETK